MQLPKRTNNKKAKNVTLLHVVFQIKITHLCDFRTTGNIAYFGFSFAILTEEVRYISLKAVLRLLYLFYTY